MFDVESNSYITFARELQQCSHTSSPSSEVPCTSQRHAETSRQNSSTHEKIYPGGVCQMTALDPELSNAPLAVKIKFCEPNLETSTANTRMLRHQPASRPPSFRASSGMNVPAQPVPPMPPIPQPLTGFLLRSNYSCATILGILLQRNVASVATATSVARTRAFGRRSRRRLRGLPWWIPWAAQPC